MGTAPSQQDRAGRGEAAHADSVGTPLARARRASPLSRWLLVVVGALGLTATVLLWRALVASDSHAGRESLALAMRGVKAEIPQALDRHLAPVIRAARHREIVGPPASQSAEWQSLARALADHDPGPAAVAWVDASLTVREITRSRRRCSPGAEMVRWFSAAGNDLPVGPAREHGHIFVSRVRESSCGPMLSAMAPVVHDGELAGFVTASYHVQQLFDAIVEAGLEPGINISLAENGRPFYQQQGLQPPLDPDRVARSSIGLHGAVWELSVWLPAGGTLSAGSSWPHAVLLVGLVLSVLLAGTVGLALAAQRTGRGLLTANLRLQNEIEKRAKVEEVTASSVARHTMMMQTLPVVLYSKSAEDDWPITWVSENAALVTGFTPDCFCSVPTFWADRIHPDDKRRVLAETGEIEFRERTVSEYRWLCASGSFRWFVDQALLIRDAQGRPREIMGTLLDTTEKVQLEESLSQAQKLEAIGRLSAGVAHDFNNMLGVMSNAAALISRKLPPDSPLQRYVEMVSSTAQRAAQLPRQLLAFARRQRLEPKVIDLNDVVSGVQTMLKRLLRENIEIVLDLSNTPCYVSADPGQLEQVLLNLAVNAGDAMPRGGQLSLATGRIVPCKSDSAPTLADLPSGAYSILVVADTGCGMDEHTRARAFEPFFTTKPPGQGTGLGLATVYGIVAQSGGAIALESEPGRGTVFRIYLPEVEPPATDAQALGPVVIQRPRRKSAATLLLVEDEGSLRSSTREVLEESYRVIDVSDGESALALCADTARRFDLLITDMVLPGMSGTELAERAASIRPDLKVMFISGYSTDPIEGELPLLEKPFTPEDLVRRIKAMLEGAPPDGAHAARPADRPKPP